MRSRVYASVGCPSVRLSLCPQTLQLRRGRQEISIDCCTAHSIAAGECEQWRVVSVHVKLNMHRLIGAAQVCGTGSVQRYGVRQSLCPIRPPHSAAAGLLVWPEHSLCNGTESVSLSVPFARRTPLLSVCCCGPGSMKYRSVAARRLAAAAPQHGEQRQMRQCHVVS